METNPKIVVFQLKELIYTVIFIILAILLILLLVFMFIPKDENSDTETTSPYTAGTYTSNVIYNSVPMEVSVKLDKDHINSIDFLPVSADITTTTPLMQNSLDDIEKQVLQNQSTLNIYSSTDNKYTYSILINAVEYAISKATH